MKVKVDKIIAADHRIIRLINRANVLNLIREKSPISRVMISRITGLNKSTISNIVGELIKENLVYEGSRGESAIGRKPIVLNLNERSRILGIIDVRLRKTALAVCDLGGNVLEHQTVDSFAGAPEEFFGLCGRKLAGMLKSFSEPLAGVAVVTPGLVNASTGFLYTLLIMKWRDVDIRGIVEKEVGCRVLVENDGKAAALAELWFASEAASLSNFVFILVCEGIGVGVVMNSSLYHGFSSMDGHFGNQLIKINGKWEDVSGESTWEDNASDTGAVKRYSEYSGTPRGEDTEADMQTVIDLAKKGDHNAIRALQETARYLGVGLTNTNNGLGPERIIIAGLLLQAWDIVLPEILHQMELQTIYQVIPVRDLLIPTSLNSAPFEGGKALVISELFSGYNIL